MMNDLNKDIRKWTRIIHQKATYCITLFYNMCNKFNVDEIILKREKPIVNYCVTTFTFDVHASHLNYYQH